MLLMFVCICLDTLLTVNSILKSRENTSDQLTGNRLWNEAPAWEWNIIFCISWCLSAIVDIPSYFSFTHFHSYFPCTYSIMKLSFYTVYPLSSLLDKTSFVSRFNFNYFFHSVSFVYVKLIFSFLLFLI